MMILNRVLNSLLVSLIKFDFLLEIPGGKERNKTNNYKTVA